MIFLLQLSYLLLVRQVDPFQLDEVRMFFDLGVGPVNNNCSVFYQDHFVAEMEVVHCVSDEDTGLVL